MAAITKRDFSKLPESELRDMYPKDLVAILDKHKHKLSEIPTLILDHNDTLIDWLKPKDLTAPIMRFETPAPSGLTSHPQLVSRPGLAFRVENPIITYSIPPRMYNAAKNQETFKRTLPRCSSVLTVFQRFKDDKSNWCCSMDDRNYEGEYEDNYFLAVFANNEDKYVSIDFLLSNKLTNVKLADGQRPAPTESSDQKSDI